MLNNILGQPSSPPPRGVKSIEPDIRGATTIREQLAKHRTVESCARCHRRIDPPGFAMESFDVIGGLRSYYRTIDAGAWLERDPRYPNRYIQYRKGPDVDSTGQTSDGQAFRDIRDYKRLLLTNIDQITRSLTGKLLACAVGRTPGFSDRPDIEAILARVKAKQYGFRTLIHEIVQSETFQSP